MAFPESLWISPPAAWRVGPSLLLLPPPSLTLVHAVPPRERLPYRAPISHYCKTVSAYTHSRHVSVHILPPVHVNVPVHRLRWRSCSEAPNTAPPKTLRLLVHLTKKTKEKKNRSDITPDPGGHRPQRPCAQGRTYAKQDQPRASAPGQNRTQRGGGATTHGLGTRQAGKSVPTQTRPGNGVCTPQSTPQEGTLHVGAVIDRPLARSALLSLQNRRKWI